MIEAFVIDCELGGLSNIMVDGEFVGKLSSDGKWALIHKQLSPAELRAVATQLDVNIRTPVEPPPEVDENGKWVFGTQGTA